MGQVLQLGDGQRGCVHHLLLVCCLPLIHMDCGPRTWGRSHLALVSLCSSLWLSPVVAGCWLVPSRCSPHLCVPVPLGVCISPIGSQHVDMLPVDSGWPPTHSCVEMSTRSAGGSGQSPRLPMWPWHLCAAPGRLWAPHRQSGRLQSVGSPRPRCLCTIVFGRSRPSLFLVREPHCFQNYQVTPFPVSLSRTERVCSVFQPLLAINTYPLSKRRENIPKLLY